MSDAKTPPDLPMDEILATIRRIISEDEQTSASVSPAAAPAGARGGSIGAAGSSTETRVADRDAADEVLELTEALNEDGSVRHLAPIGSSAHGERVREPPPPSVASSAGPQPEAKKEPEFRRDTPASSGAAREPDAPADGGDLVSEVTSFAAAAAFARLAAAPRVRREPPLIGDRPLDDVVRDLLRPMLQTWLEENLPGLVERLVEAEIARVASRSGLG